jgi:hypothetical protein
MTNRLLLMILAVTGCAQRADEASSHPGSAIDDVSGGSPVDNVAPLFVGPTAKSVAAAKATANDNALCAAVAPFYWEIGDQHQALVTGSIGVDAQGHPITATTSMSIASASKWIYGTYAVQLRGAASNLTLADIAFLHFTSGYSNLGNSTTSACPSTDTPDTVNTCLTLINPANNQPYSYQDPTTIGKFAYDGGHLENHASLYGALGNVLVGALGSTVAAMLGSGVTLFYTEPLLAGGLFTTADNYALILRHVLDGSLAMHDALGTHAVCTLPSASCNAASSPIPEAWHYSMAHWVEDDAATHGDGTFSSAGAFGFYPWIGASKQYYGVIARQVAANGAIRSGYNSAKCGRLIRRAWDTGVEQTGTIPD